MKNINTKARNKNIVKPHGPIEGLSWAVYQISPERQEKLLIAFAHWSKLEDSLQLEWFYESEKITEDIWRALCERDERFKVINKHGRALIGARREKLMWGFKMNTQVGLPIQYRYSTDFREALEEKIALQKELAAKQKAEPVEVTIKYIPDTGVPLMKLESISEDINEI